MRAGRLRQRITIQQNTPTRNGVGEEVESWSAFGGRARSARIVPLAGRELFGAQQRHAEAEYRIEMRFLLGITPAMRVAHDSRVFDILHVANVEERDRETHLLVKERF
jgi:SPP1 family predicted phage head-tail adaptor